MVKPLKIFYTTDIHGSETCFLKFVNAGKFYAVDLLIMGGDITGKMLIPIVDQGGGVYQLSFLGKEHRASGEALELLEKQIRQTGYYPYRTDPDEVREMKADPQLVESMFARLMRDGFARWLGIAEERLKDTGIRCLITPGNDDQMVIDQAFETQRFVTNPEGQVIELDEHHEMISTGYANITPWHCPRDIEEEELARKVEDMAGKVKKMENCVFNFHCPPHDSNLDLAPRLDKTLKPVIGPGGGPYMDPVGSTAIRKAIEKHQPLLALHGHIHESRGTITIGRTLCVNPGSEYAEGYLRGALIVLKAGKITACQLTTG